MALYSAVVGNLLTINSASCAIGPGASTVGSFSTFVGPNAGVSSSTNCTNVVAIGSAANVGSLATDSVAVGYSCSIGATDNTVAIGAGSFGNTPNTFILGNSTNPLIPVINYAPFTHFRNVYTYSASHNFYTDSSVTAAAPLVSGILLFNISTSSTLTLPSTAACFAQMHDYVSGSYVWSYVCNTNGGSASLTIYHPAGTNYYGPTSLSAGHGFKFLIKVNGAAIDYIM